MYLPHYIIEIWCLCSTTRCLRYEGELEKEMQGPTFQLLSKMMKVKIFSSLFLLPSKKNESSCINYGRYEGAGEEKDHCARFFSWPLIHSCCVLLLQGFLDCSNNFKIKGGFLVDFLPKSLLSLQQAASGFIYPLERGLIFIYKPPIFVKYEDVQSINFARYENSLLELA